MKNTKSDNQNSNKGVRPLRVISPIHTAHRQASIRIEQLLSDLDVSAPEAHIVSYLNVHGPCAVGDLVQVFGTKRPTMTSLLDRLEGRGLLHREVNPDDRRSFLVAVTPAGAGVGATARTRVERLEAEITKRTTPLDLRGFENVARAVAEVTGVDLRGSRTTKPREGGRKRS